MLRICAFVAAALSAIMVNVAPAGATSLSFTETTTASGSLGGAAFSDALVTLSGTGDTSGIANPSFGFFVLAGVPVKVSVAGHGQGSFTDTIELISNQNISAVGLGDNSLGIGLLFADVTNTGYDLSTSFGPASGPSRFNSGSAFGTTLGDLVLNSTLDVTYQATVGGVPEPASWSMMLAGFGGLGAVLRSRRRFLIAV